MSETQTAPHSYSLGHSHPELERLQRQHQFIGSFTERCLRDAGIRPGMKVLDAGCGPGDVSLVLAEMVGARGQVVGVDISPVALETARRRAGEAGYRNLSFREGNLLDIELENDFDAITGRLILFHLKDPVMTLQKLLDHLKPGGLVIFQDYDLTPCTAYPPSPLFEKTISNIMNGFKLAGADPHIGLKLPQIFTKAGLPQPELRCEASVSTSPDWLGFDQLANVTRSLLPAIVKFGLATPEEIEVETLAQRLQSELVSIGGIGRGPDVISAWSRKA